MPLYEYRCDHGYTTEDFAPMGEARASIWTRHPLPDGHIAHCRFARVFSFRHVEDRRHMRRGRSLITGQEYATSRTEERAIEKERGIEFIGPSEMPEQWKRLREYGEHIKTGGERLGNEAINPEPFVSTKGDLLKKAAELGVHLGS